MPSSPEPSTWRNCSWENSGDLVEDFAEAEGDGDHGVGPPGQLDFVGVQPAHSQKIDFVNG